MTTSKTAYFSEFSKLYNKLFFSSFVMIKRHDVLLHQIKKLQRVNVHNVIDCLLPISTEFKSYKRITIPTRLKKGYAVRNNYSVTAGSTILWRRIEFM